MQRAWQQPAGSISAGSRRKAIRERLPAIHAADAHARGRAMRAALEDLGPVFASLGRYLASRPDVLPAGCLDELAGIADHGAPAPWSEARELIERDLGSSVADVFPHIDTQPFESRLVFQSHRGRLADGAAVCVRVIRPEVRRHLEDLDQVRPVLAELGGAVLESVAGQFTSAFLRRLDFSQEARILRALAQLVEDTETIRVPAVHTRCCGTDVLTLGWVSGDRVADLLQARGQDYIRRECARRLSVAWLHQFLSGSALAAELRPDDVLVTGGTGLALTGAVEEGVPEESRDNLWNYLIAVSCDDVDVACDCLLTEVARPGRLQAHELKQRFRQVVPFRDGHWGQYGNTVAGHVLVHWRLLTERGCELRPQVTSFFRGLFGAVDTARLLAPGYDALFDALRDVRLNAGLTRLRGLADRRQLGEQMENMSALLLNMPKWMDAALSPGPEGIRINVQLPDGVGSRRKSNAFAAIAAIAILMAAFAVFAQRITPALVGAAWSERVNALIFLLLGAVLLRIASRV